MIARLTAVCVSIIVITLLFTCISYAKIDPKSIVGMWFFEEYKGDIAKDSSGNGNDGKIIGAKWVEGKFGSALEFNGASDYVDCGNDPILNPTSEITVAAWVQLASSQPAGLGWSIVAKGWDAKITPYTLWHLNDWVGVQAGMYGFAFGTYAPGWAVAGSPDSESLAEDKKWNHVLGTFDGSKFNIYVNGNFIASSPTSTLLENDVITTIGAYVEGGGIKYYFNGTIDDVAIFNVALTQDDIKSIATNGLSSALAVSPVSPAGKLAATWAAIKAR